MTVAQTFNNEKLDIGFIEDNFDTTEKYWDSCDHFIVDNWSTDIEHLSEKQGAWFTKILDDCVEKRIEG